jgi:hypothetical protein
MSSNLPTKPNSATRSATIRPISSGRLWLRRLLNVVVIAGALGAGGYAIWQNVRPHVLASPHYQIGLDDVAVTPPPKWIRSDVKAEVVRDAEVNGSLSVLDEDLAQRMHQAFESHPWVAKVLRVTKLPPAQLQVDLVYRQPVCMVQVPDGLFPIDIAGVLLPTADFSPHEAARYPRFSNAPLPTEPPAGSVWQDERIFAAARLAATLGGIWEEMNLRHFELTSESGSGFDFQLLTKKGTRVFWGPAPSGDEAGQALAKAKLARLKQYFAERGTLEGPRGTQDLDLRHGAEIHAVPRTALKPE